MPVSSQRMSAELAILQQWAELGRTYASRRVSQSDWSAVERLIKAAAPYLRDQAGELRDLLKEWSNKFGMQDPLLSDLGAHRWLDKETSYSDWLAWVLERLEPNAVFEVLGFLGLSCLKSKPTKKGRNVWTVRRPAIKWIMSKRPPSASPRDRRDHILPQGYAHQQQAALNPRHWKPLQAAQQISFIGGRSLLWRHVHLRYARRILITGTSDCPRDTNFVAGASLGSAKPGSSKQHPYLR